MTETEALAAAQKIGYPVLMRPSYVLGGQNMIIAWNDEDIREYMTIILMQDIENPVLIDKYLMGTELEVDAICDGEEILIPGIMEHVERAGIHSGDSIAVYPAWNIDDDMREIIVSSTSRLALALKTIGLVNIQYLISNGKLFVIEVNPRSSRTIPYISKVTGVPMVELATKCMVGQKLCDMGYGTGLYRKSPYVAVKVPVFSFEKLLNVDTMLGPEMKSTGEVLGIATTREEALYKGCAPRGTSSIKRAAYSSPCATATRRRSSTSCANSPTSGSRSTQRPARRWPSRPAASTLSPSAKSTKATPTASRSSRAASSTTSYRPPRRGASRRAPR
jgi:carbamoyl-phosphate synthase large subunit